MFQAFRVALLACIVFPMPNGLLRLPLLLLAPLVNWFANGLGVALLLLIASMDLVYSVEGTGAFSFVIWAIQVSCFRVLDSLVCLDLRKDIGYPAQS